MAKKDYIRYSIDLRAEVIRKYELREEETIRIGAWCTNHLFVSIDCDVEEALNMRHRSVPFAQGPLESMDIEFGPPGLGIDVGIPNPPPTLAEIGAMREQWRERESLSSSSQGCFHDSIFLIDFGSYTFGSYTFTQDDPCPGKQIQSIPNGNVVHQDAVPAPVVSIPHSISPRTSSHASNRWSLSAIASAVSYVLSFKKESGKADSTPFYAAYSIFTPSTLSASVSAQASRLTIPAMEAEELERNVSEGDEVKEATVINTREVLAERTVNEIDDDEDSETEFEGNSSATLCDQQWEGGKHEDLHLNKPSQIRQTTTERVEILF
ncbi:hypothetical protein BT69DRAFT_1300529 [Atractiella rhizophila]|nr:hypothetical protein BT69DRAFT_1300529 [Atractiella rhizophila]